MHECLEIYQKREKYLKRADIFQDKDLYFLEWNESFFYRNLTKLDNL